MKKLVFSLLGLMLLIGACKQSENPPVSEETPVEDSTQSGKEILDDLRDKAVSEDDLLGRLRSSLIPVQEEFARSENSMPQLSGVEVSVDENCQLTILNKAEGEIATKVNLGQLNTEGFSLIPDMTEDEFPGVRVSTLDEAAVVEIYRNGELLQKNNELVIHLVDRPAIERITPVILQMIMICQGKI